MGQVTRHQNQQNTMIFGKRRKTPAQDHPMPVAGLSGSTDPATRERDVAAFDAMRASKPLHRPHPHVYVRGKCKVCSQAKPKAEAQP